jgi:hypothetical protein
MARRKQPSIPDALLDQLLDGSDSRTAFKPDGVLDALKKALAERMLNAEMDQHLDGETADALANTRNGYGQKTVLTDTGRLALEIPRDRQGKFDPQLIAKYQRRFPGFDEKIVSMYARGMSVREIQGHIRELYGLDISPDLVSAVTDAVLEEVALWQNRPLEPVYPWCSSTPCESKSATRGSCVTRPSTSRSASGQTEPRKSSPLDRAERRRQVLATRHERTEEPRHRGHSARRGGRAEGLSRGNPGRLPRSHSSDLQHPPAALLAGFRILQGSQSCRHRPEGHLPRHRPSCRRHGAGRV